MAPIAGGTWMLDFEIKEFEQGVYQYRVCGHEDVAGASAAYVKTLDRFGTWYYHLLEGDRKNRVLGHAVAHLRQSLLEAREDLRRYTRTTTLEELGDNAKG